MNGNYSVNPPCPPNKEKQAYYAILLEDCPPNISFWSWAINLVNGYRSSPHKHTILDEGPYLRKLCMLSPLKKSKKKTLSGQCVYLSEGQVITVYPDVASFVLIIVLATPAPIRDSNAAIRKKEEC